ncbi:MAG TPA: RluA family pseudouridine synthase [Burkholderiaceae bacterium]|nr:RluA family pseudouridine synthase [Burkholderiaceae bacterium]
MICADYIDPAPEPDEDDDADDDAPRIDARQGAAAAHGVRAPAEVAGQRFDKALAMLVPEHSRARLREWIESGSATLNGAPAKPRATVVAGDRIEWTEVPTAADLAYAPEPLPLAIVYEDESIIVLDKPSGLVVHPGAGNWGGTLLNGLLAHDPGLASVPRAGIVHRLDAATSGLMVVARTAAAQTNLVRQLQQRTVTREYWAIVFGALPEAGTIDAPIARDPRHPRRFATSRAAGARHAVTNFRRAALALEGAQRFSWAVCRLQTGRTHQIRVHFESIGHPLVGDPVYRLRRPRVAASERGAPWDAFPRQALHACRLALAHPRDDRRMAWFAAPPADLRALMKSFRWEDVDAPVELFDGRSDE